LETLTINPKLLTILRAWSSGFRSRSEGLLGIARHSAPGASYCAHSLADQPMPLQQLYGPRLGVLYCYVTVLDWVEAAV
jgi:hypothetical protein